MNRTTPLLLIALLASLFAMGQDVEKFYGKLDAELAPDLVHIYQKKFLGSAAEPGVKIESGSTIAKGKLIDERLIGGESAMMLIEPPKGVPYLWLDGNGNGKYESDERHPLALVTGTTGTFQTTLQLPITNQFYKTFPIFVEYERGLTGPGFEPDDRVISQSVYALAFGKVDIRGRKVLFQYPFELASPVISTKDGLFGVDSDADGKVRNEQFSIETSFADKEEIVFPLGDMFVSTAAIDMKLGTITVRRRDPKEYRRVDLVVGTEMPDFSFTDIARKTRTLAEFRGKYLLIDFWGAWCSDCRRETPFHLAAYKQFKSRGFEILGLNTDEMVGTAKGYITKNNITWPQATNDSINDLTKITYRIQEYPSTILLSPEGRVLVLDQKQLQGNELLKTLDRVLPNKP